MEYTSTRTILSVLRTLLYAIDRDPAILADSSSVLEFRRSTMKLIAEIQSALGIEEELVRQGLEAVSRDTARKAHRRPQIIS